MYFLKLHPILGPLIAMLVSVAFTRNQAFAVIRMNHYTLSSLAAIQIFSRKDNRLRYSFDIKQI